MYDKFDDINKILERETLIREKLQELEKIFNLIPKDADLYLRRGALYYKIGEYKKAIDDLTEAIELNPKVLEAYKLRANIYTTLQKYQ
jgi:tetratricopeptide (TPR) repeat protein